MNNHVHVYVKPLCFMEFFTGVVISIPPNGHPLRRINPAHNVQSLMFLTEASDFFDSLEEANHADADASFRRFETIVEKYIKNGSPFEVNISFKTKAAILGVANAENFRELTRVRSSPNATREGNP